MGRATRSWWVKSCPIADANNAFWTSTGSASGTTVPLGWDTNSFPAADPACNGKWQAATAPLGCRYSAAAKGFASRHPGGRQHALRRRIGPLPQEEHHMPTYCALGSRNGGEVLSSDHCY